MVALLLTVLVSTVIVGVLIVNNISTKNKLNKTRRDLADIRNKEVDIQSKVENIKDEMKRITDLYITSDNLIHIQEEDEIYNEITNTLQRFFNYQSILIYALDNEKRVFRKKICIPYTSNFAEEIPYVEMRVQEIKTEREISCMVYNTKNKPLYYIKMVGRRVKAQTGYIDSLFTENDISVITIYLKQTSMVLDRIRAYKQMERMALTDSLTGLYNRHYAYLRVKEEVKRANRENYPISVVFVDIDKFKSINDTFGHDVGDLALQHVSTLLKEASREYDVTVRWGGEEFVLFLPNTSEEGALILAERLRTNIETSNFKYCKITASLGIASYPKDDLNIEKVIGYADTALYHSKQTGRNRTTVFSNIKGTR